ncbi:MAG: hypothetical protein KC613_18595, partial [Myxococcales bacterium]|nr:hypothetical protein [Myxococcales bacterium]
MRRTPPVLGVAALALALSGCPEQAVDPAPKTVEVVFFTPEPTDAGAPRAALVWVGPEAAEVVADAPLVDGSARLALTPPPLAVRTGFRPLETVRFADAENGRTYAEGPAIRPRLAVYDDRDRDGTFDLPPPFGQGRD